MKQERSLLDQRESEIFHRFLDNCEKAYEDVFLGRLTNPFKGERCQELENEKPQQTVENPEESTPNCVPKEIDHLEINKYSPE